MSSESVRPGQSTAMTHMPNASAGDLVPIRPSPDRFKELIVQG